MIRNLARIECDLCGERGPEAPDCLSVRPIAKRMKWRLLSLDVYGNELHFCPKCATGKSDEELYQRAVKQAEEEDK